MKKWLSAIVLSKDNLIKIWDCQVSEDVTDVTVPDNTVFYFFSTKKAKLETEQLNFQDIAVRMVRMKNIYELVLDHKLYCCGKKKAGMLITESNVGKIIWTNFFDELKGYNFEFV